MLIALLVLIGLSACTFPGQVPTPTVEPSPEPTVIVEPTATPTSTEPPTPTAAPTETTVSSPTATVDGDAGEVPPVQDLVWETVADAPGRLRHLAGITTEIVDAVPSPNGRWWTIELIEERVMAGPARTVVYAIDSEGEMHWSVTHDDLSDWHQQAWLSDNALLFIHRGELARQSFDEILQIESPQRIHEVWVGTNDIALASGRTTLWRVDLSTMEWEEVGGLEDIAAMDESLISRPQADLTISPDGTFAAATVAGELWRVPLTMGEPAELLATIEYPGRGGRITPPEPLADSPYWSTGESALRDGRFVPQLLDTRDGRLVPVAELLEDAGVDRVPTGNPDVSPDGRWLAIPLADPGATAQTPPTAFYLAEAGNLTAGRVVEGTALVAWQQAPAAVVLHDNPHGTVSRVPLLGGDPIPLDVPTSAQEGEDERILGQGTQDLIVVASGADIFAFTHDGTLVDSFTLPGVVARFYGAAGNTVAFGTGGSVFTAATEFWLWEPTATPDDGAPTDFVDVTDWETYRLDDVSLKYPPAWEIIESPEGGIQFFADERFGEGPEPLVYNVAAQVLPNPEGRSFEEVATQGLSDDLKAQFEFTRETIGPFKAYRTASLPSRSGMLTVFLTREDEQYVKLALTPYVTQQPWPEQARYVAIFEAMLHTVSVDAVTSTGPDTASQEELQRASEALISFFDALANQEYDRAAAYWGGGYEPFSTFVPEDTPARMLEQTCAGVFRCLEIADVVLAEQIAPSEFRFVVEFRNEEGTTFTRGPCCGASEEEMPPQSTFEYRVEQRDGGFVVTTPPVYVP